MSKYMTQAKCFGHIRQCFVNISYNLLWIFNLISYIERVEGVSGHLREITIKKNSKPRHNISN